MWYFRHPFCVVCGELSRRCFIYFAPGTRIVNVVAVVCHSCFLMKLVYLLVADWMCHFCLHAVSNLCAQDYFMKPVAVMLVTLSPVSLFLYALSHANTTQELQQPIYPTNGE